LKKAAICTGGDREDAHVECGKKRGEVSTPKRVVKENSIRPMSQRKKKTP